MIFFYTITLSTNKSPDPIKKNMGHIVQPKWTGYTYRQCRTFY